MVNANDISSHAQVFIDLLESNETLMNAFQAVLIQEQIDIINARAIKDEARLAILQAQLAALQGE